MAKQVKTKSLCDQLSSTWVQWHTTLFLILYCLSGMCKINRNDHFAFIFRPALAALGGHDCEMKCPTMVKRWRCAAFLLLARKKKKYLHRENTKTQTTKTKKKKSLLFFFWVSQFADETMTIAKSEMNGTTIRAQEKQTETCVCARDP